MFNVIRKILKALAWTVGIILIVGLILVGLFVPKLLVNLGGCALLLGAAFVIVSSFFDSVEKKDFLMPSDEELRRRYRRNWFY